MAYELVALIPDTHRPYHHRKAYGLMMKVLHDVQPTGVYLLGDYADFYSVSSHPKDPKVCENLVDEVEDVNRGLDEIDLMMPRAKKVYIEGNHENRLERYLAQKAPELFGVTSVEHLFKINQRPLWTFIPYDPDQSTQICGSFLKARHEPLGTSAKATATKALCSLVYGHIHRIEESHIVGLDGTNHVCFSVGWLGDKRKDVFKYVKGHWQWQLGFGFVVVDTVTKLFYHQKVHIIDFEGELTCCAFGKIYKA